VNADDASAAEDGEVGRLAAPAAYGLRIDTDELCSLFDCDKQRRRVRTWPRFARTHQRQGPLNAVLANRAPEKGPQPRHPQWLLERLMQITAGFNDAFDKLEYSSKGPGGPPFRSWSGGSRP